MHSIYVHIPAAIHIHTCVELPNATQFKLDFHGGFAFATFKHIHKHLFQTINLYSLKYIKFVQY